MDESVQKSTARDHYCLTKNLAKDLGSHATYARLFAGLGHQKFFDRILADRKIWSVFETVFHIPTIEAHIRLSPRRPDCRSLGAIENAKLDTSRIDRFPHLPT